MFSNNQTVTLNHFGKTTVTFESKYDHFHIPEYIFEKSPVNGDHFLFMLKYVQKMLKVLNAYGRKWIDRGHLTGAMPEGRP